MTNASTPADRGRTLEQRIAAYFGHHGYVVEMNRVLVGRSGGHHEIDVLAEKADPLTLFRVAVECKAWDSPIEKDVVAKLHYVMTDLGLNKGVIVSLSGSRSGADKAAAELGIDLWGPDELRHRLGDGVFADVAALSSNGRHMMGWPFGADPERARQTALGVGRGRLGVRTVETLTWFSPVWVPAHLVHLSVAQPATRRLRRFVTSTPLVNIYDALEGRLQRRPFEPPAETAAGEVTVVRPLRRETQAQATLRKAVDARLKVTSPAAIERYDANLLALGLPTPLHGISIDGTEVVHLPVYVGLLQRHQERVVAVDGVTGQVDDRLGLVLTGQLAHLRAAFA